MIMKKACLLANFKLKTKEDLAVYIMLMKIKVKLNSMNKLMIEVISSKLA